jgi:hypothetical protein
MHYVYLVPSWFIGFDIIMELMFAVICLVVAAYAFKVYRLSGQRQPKLFGISFLFISASYFVQSILNSLIVFEINERVEESFDISVGVLNGAGLYLHILLFMAGLLTLAYMTLHIKSVKAYSLLITLLLLPLVFSQNRLYLFYILSSLLLIFILMHYAINYWSNRQKKTLLVLVAFMFLLVGSIHFVLAVNHAVFYVIGHVLGLVAYLLILSNLILVVKHEQKKG